MVKEIRNCMFRSQQTLLSDAAGAVALIVMLLVSLHFPGLN